MGKITGGGLPAAAYGGPRSLLERIAPAGDVYQAGTLSGNPLAVAAALATLRRLDAQAYARLADVSEALAAGLREAAASAGRDLRVQSVPGLVTPFFCAEAGRRLRRRRRRATRDAYGAWCRELLARGVYPPASQFEAWFPSLAHTDADVEATVAGGAGGLRGDRVSSSPSSARERPATRRSTSSCSPTSREGVRLHYGEPGEDPGPRPARRATCSTRAAS